MHVALARCSLYAVGAFEQSISSNTSLLISFGIVLAMATSSSKVRKARDVGSYSPSTSMPDWAELPTASWDCNSCSGHCHLLAYALGLVRCRVNPPWSAKSPRTAPVPYTLISGTQSTDDREVIQRHILKGSVPLHAPIFTELQLLWCRYMSRLSWFFISSFSTFWCSFSNAYQCRHVF